MLLNQDYIRETYKRAISREILSEERRFTIDSNPFFDLNQRYDLFISHSFKDKETVNGLRYLFTQAGLKIYIDWIDDKELDRNNVDENTALLLNLRSREFIPRLWYND